MAKGKLSPVQSHTNVYVPPQKLFFFFESRKRNRVKDVWLWCNVRGDLLKAGVGGVGGVGGV